MHSEKTGDGGGSHVHTKRNLVEKKSGKGKTCLAFLYNLSAFDKTWLDGLFYALLESVSTASAGKLFVNYI